MLYAKILKNDMLHYGYFEDAEIPPDNISINAIEEAQVRYSERIIELIKQKSLPVLDVGCGMCGLSNMLMKNGINVEALTPDENQKRHISKKYPGLTCHHTKFEPFSTETKYGTIINSESLQYINLDEAFAKVEDILLPGGQWIIADYFRVKTETVNKSGHMLNDFLGAVEKHGWEIAYEQDITANILPTLKFIYMYVDRFIEPLLAFGYEKLKYKKAWLYYLTDEIRESIGKKIDQEINSIDPYKFAE